MARCMQAAFVSLTLLLGGPAFGQAGQPSLVSIETPRGVTQAFILIRPDKPVASVVLFAGGRGALGLTGASSMQWGSGNFLVRSRSRFVEHDFIVAVVDTPSDQQQGMNAIFRMGGDHVGDIAALVAYLKQLADVPVWLVGTSMGTFSAAAAAIAVRNIDGLVLTSTITRAKPDWLIAQSYPDGVASLELKKIDVPTLIMSHRDDGCDVTPAADAEKLRERLSSARKLEVVLLAGGDAPQSEPCEAYSQHGFLGMEEETIATIAKFIKANRN